MEENGELPHQLTFTIHIHPLAKWASHHHQRWREEKGMQLQSRGCENVEMYNMNVNVFE
jgi:hypothetical protein